MDIIKEIKDNLWIPKVIGNQIFSGIKNAIKGEKTEYKQLIFILLNSGRQVFRL